jgi:hypothetical protein
MEPSMSRSSGQWLAAWTLSAFVATMALALVLSALATPMVEQTGFKMVHLQLSGAHPLLAWTPWGKTPTKDILAAWKDKGLLAPARRAQLVDFVFPPVYGAFALLLAIGLRRVHAVGASGGRWIWGVAAGAGAAVLDECENLCLWRVLQHPDDPSRVLAALAAVAAVLKMTLLAAALGTFLFAVFRARA